MKTKLKVRGIDRNIFAILFGVLYLGIFGKSNQPAFTTLFLGAVLVVTHLRITRVYVSPKPHNYIVFLILGITPFIGFFSSAYLWSCQDQSKLPKAALASSPAKSDFGSFNQHNASPIAYAAFIFLIIGLAIISTSDLNAGGKASSGSVFALLILIPPANAFFFGFALLCFTALVSNVSPKFLFSVGSLGLAVSVVGLIYSFLNSKNVGGILFLLPCAGALPLAVMFLCQIFFPRK